MKIINSENLSGKYFQDNLLQEIGNVNSIIEDVKVNGDKAVKKYTLKFDELNLDNYKVSSKEIKTAYAKLTEDKIQSIKAAALNIESFAKLQMSMYKDIESDENGYLYGQKIIPIQKIGCYVPGGRYPLPSSALMTIIPAKVAGVSKVIVCSPKISPETLVASDIAGADTIFKIGGAQAIAAMAFGTESVPRVDKIVGPGNKYVTAAKKRVYGAVGIDFLAGPSEVMIIADETADPEIIAADLLAQAEHDIHSRSDLITTSLELAEKVSIEVGNQLEDLETKKIASKAIENSQIIVVKSIDEAVEIANLRAPEHLELQLEDNDQIISQLYNYGSLFISSYSAEVFGDYCSGPNHTLPTSKVARYSGGLSVKEYLKVVTYQRLNKSSLPELIEISSKMASMEGLHAHRRAAEIRRKLL